MKNLIILWLIVLSLILVGCGEPIIDASSDESIKTSVEKVRTSLPESKQAEFDNAIKILMFNSINFKDLLAAGSETPKDFENKIYKSIDGKTAEQVIEESERIIQERKEREYKQAIEEIKELETKKVKAERAREELKQFQVVRSRFYFREQQYLGKQPIIEITVLNGTTEAISRAYFEGTITSPDRSVPWHKDGFNYKISGGLESGEKAKWILAPNMFSDWGKVEAPVDAIFTVIVEQLDGPEGKPIFSTRAFSESDKERLNKLKAQYGIK